MDTTAPNEFDTVRQAWEALLETIYEDSDARQRLIDDPSTVLGSAGIQSPDGKPFEVLDGTDANYLVLPPAPPSSATAVTRGLLADSGVVRLHSTWYYDSLELSEDVLQKVLGVATVAQGVAVLAAIAVNPAFAVFVAWILVEKGAIQLVNNGNGVFLTHYLGTSVILIIPSAR